MKDITNMIKDSVGWPRSQGKCSVGTVLNGHRINVISKIVDTPLRLLTIILTLSFVNLQPIRLFLPEPSPFYGYPGVDVTGTSIVLLYPIFKKEYSPKRVFPTRVESVSMLFSRIYKN